MARPFILITATDPTDPVVGSAFVARKSLAGLHSLLLEACYAHNLQPFVFIAHEDPELASVYDHGSVTKITNVYDNSFPLFNMLMSALGENGLADTQAVFFDDAMSFDVEVFVECWRRVYPMVPLPPFFGMIHATDRGGYAQQGVLDWHKEQVRKLSLFREMYATSDQAADSLRARAVSNLRATSPYFGLDTRKVGSLTRSQEVKLNWIYSFSHVDRYDQYILLANQLNAIIKNRIAGVAGEVVPDLDLPTRCSPHLYSRELPEGLALPQGFKPGEFAAGQSFKLGVLDNFGAWPQTDSITISFKPEAEVDYRLLKLAEVGYMVLAPDRGVYREALDPVCTYPSEWLESYNTEVPEKVTLRIAEEFMERLLRLRLTWYERHEKSNTVSGERAAFLRRVVRSNVKRGPDNVVDRVFTHLGLAY